MRTVVTKTLMATVLLAGVLGPGVVGGANSISIVHPKPGEAVYFGGTIEIAVSGLYSDLVPRIDIVIWAKSKESVFAITRYAGSSYVPLSEELEATLDMPAKLVWTNKRAGQGRVFIKWNWLPVGFSDGDYELKVDFFLKISDRAAIVWAETPWQNNKLIARQWVQIDSPAPGTQFYCGDQIEVKGSIINLRPPVIVFLEVSTTLQDWKVVAQKKLAEGRFVLFWNTEDELAGEYWLRVRTMSEDGRALVGEPQSIILLPRPLPPKILVFGKRFVGVDLRFAIEGEHQWASFEWDFGDGTRSVERSPTHKYLKAGKYLVKLTVYSEPGFRGTSKSTYTDLIIEERIAVKRTILGYPWLDPLVKCAFLNHKVDIKVEIKILYPVDAFTVREEAPVGYVAEPRTWEVQPQDFEIMGLHTRINDRVLQWVFHAQPGAFKTKSQLPADVTIIVSYSISLLRPPKEALQQSQKVEGSALVSMEGVLRDVKIQGENTFWVVDSLPLCVAIAFLEQRSGGEWKLKDPVEGDVFIAEEGIRYALHFLQTGEVVPYTNQTMSIDAYLKLYAMFLYKIPIRHCNRFP